MSADPTPRTALHRCDWLASYTGSRAAVAHPRLRTLAVFALLFGTALLLWALPVPPGLGKPGLYAALAAVALIGRYLRVAQALGWTALVLFVVIGVAVHGLHTWLGGRALLLLGSAALTVGIGLSVELARRHGQSLLRAVSDDAVRGPAWLAAAVAGRLGRNR